MLGQDNGYHIEFINGSELALRTKQRVVESELSNSVQFFDDESDNALATSSFLGNSNIVSYVIIMILRVINRKSGGKLKVIFFKSRDFDFLVSITSSSYIERDDLSMLERRIQFILRPYGANVSLISDNMVATFCLKGRTELPDDASKIASM